ncbi:MAG: chemotaxis protein CheW [Candidatus Anammoxibacter sp.]
MGNKSKSDLILDEVKRRKSKGKIVDVEEEKVKLVIFTLIDDFYAFYGDGVKEILIAGKITYVPGSSDFIHGIINVRGDIESVLNIHKLIGLSDGEITSNSRIAIAEKDEIRSGILVDSVNDVVDLPKSSIKPPISTLSDSVKEFVIGETTYNKQNITILDIGKMFEKIRA